MNIQEEYWKRKSLDCPLIEYKDRSHILLTCKNEKLKDKSQWLQVFINSFVEGNGPTKYHFHINGIPNNKFDLVKNDVKSQVLVDRKVNWELYETEVENLIKSKIDYKAVPKKDALFEAWKIFILKYDLWLSNFTPEYIIDFIYNSLCSSFDTKLRKESITVVENYLRNQNEKIYSSWKAVRAFVEDENYADWLTVIFNQG